MKLSFGSLFQPESANIKKVYDKNFTADQFRTNVKILQAAHDLRSPLAALGVLVDCLSQIPEQERIIARSAIARIQDIAQDILAAK